MNDKIYFEMSRIRDGLSDKDTDSQYELLLRNRSVAVVGPARTLIGKGQGKLIDSHDIVIRLNETFEQLPVPSNLAADIGTKADIFYCNQVVLRKHLLQQQKVRQAELAKICNLTGTRYFVCTNNGLSFDKTGSPGRTCDRQDRNLNSDFKTFLARQNMQAGFRIAYTASETIMRWMRGQCGRTGFVAIVDLLHFGIERLYVTGMTFYHGGGHLLSSDSVDLHPLKNRDGTWARDRTGFGHDSFAELELMRLLVQCFGKRIEVDEVLSSLLYTK
jgi:hypothetical protein